MWTAGSTVPPSYDAATMIQENQVTKALIHNRTFDEMEVGETATLVRTLSRDDILLFAAVSGDVNPAHVDEEFARSDLFQKVIAHGMWGAALISTVLGTELPGPGTIYLGQTLRFRKPVGIGDTLRTTVSVKAKNPKTLRIVFECQCVNQRDELVISGEAEVLAPKDKITRPRKALPEVKLVERFVRFGELIRMAEPKPPIAAAVVHPVDAVTLLNCLEARKDNLIWPILVGPEQKIRSIAEKASIDLGELRIVSAEHSHAAAEIAAQMAVDGEVEMILKGTLSSRELMSAIQLNPRLGTDRTVSHVHALDIPTFPRILYVTDTELNETPDLSTKRGIVQNAANLLHALGNRNPKVAILSASDLVDLRMPSTLDAAALCKMAERGQIEGAMVDGPMPFDMAVSDEVAQSDRDKLPVSGNAEILVVPGMEAGRILVQQLKRLVDAAAAGIILGLRVPVVLPGPTDNVRTCEASCALAAMWARYYQEQLVMKKSQRTPRLPLA